jgi:hypothetical protein
VDEELLKLYGMQSSMDIPVELDLDELASMPEPERVAFLRVRLAFIFISFPCHGPPSLTRPPYGSAARISTVGAGRRQISRRGTPVERYEWGGGDPKTRISRRSWSGGWLTPHARLTWQVPRFIKELLLRLSCLPGAATRLHTL